MLLRFRSLKVPFNVVSDGLRFPEEGLLLGIGHDLETADAATETFAHAAHFRGLDVGHARAVELGYDTRSRLGLVGFLGFIFDRLTTLGGSNFFTTVKTTRIPASRKSAVRGGSGCSAALRRASR